jgi:Na+/H+ antiporter NhaD/arsenite permease-like protein
MSMNGMLLSIFAVGYLLIAFEHVVKINKAATALITGVFCWTVLILGAEKKQAVTDLLSGQMGDIAGILFFLLGAMTIVELIDAHSGFRMVTQFVRQTHKRCLLWIVGIATFFCRPSWIT